MLDDKNSQELIVSEESVYSRLKINDILSQKRDFNLIGMHALTQLQHCLKEGSEEFDSKKYKDRIEKLKIQINIGNTILDLINKGVLTAEVGTDKQQEESQKLKDTVQNNLNNLESNKKKLEEFLNKVPLIAQYKEDTDKYTKEILEIIDIIN